MEERATPEGARITIVNTGQSFICPREELILDAGLGAGLALPHNCRGGACGTCKADVIEGAVDHGWVMSFAITDEEKAAGKCLICQSRPASDRLVIRMHGDMAASEEAPPAPLEATGSVVAAEAVTPAIRRLVVALPADVRFRFTAGQHVEIRTPGLARLRTYSIATAPDERGLAPEGLLEFFVTRHAGGQASGWLHRPDLLGQPITLHGPYGTFGLPRAATGPVLALAGGSGLAPLLAVVRHALARGSEEPIRLVLSVRDRSEVFALDALCRLARRHGNFSFVVTLTRADGARPASEWRRGRVPTWLGDDLPDLGGWWVLTAGPPGFVEDCTAAARRLGASDERLRSDSFTPTADH